MLMFFERSLSKISMGRELFEADQTIKKEVFIPCRS